MIMQMSCMTTENKNQTFDDSLLQSILDYIQQQDSKILPYLLRTVEADNSSQKMKVLGILRSHMRNLESGKSLKDSLLTLCYSLVNKTEVDYSQSALILEEAMELAISIGDSKQQLITLRDLVHFWSLAGEPTKARQYLARAIQVETTRNRRKPSLGRCSQYRKSDAYCKKYIQLGLICPYNARKGLCKLSPKSRKKPTRSKDRGVLVFLAVEIPLGLAVNLLSSIYFQWSLTQDIGMYLIVNMFAIAIGIAVAWHFYQDR